MSTTFDNHSLTHVDNDQLERFRQIFSLCDSENKGYINLDGWLLFASQLPEDEARNVFLQLDDDHDGIVRFPEFSRGCATLYGAGNAEKNPEEADPENPSSLGHQEILEMQGQVFKLQKLYGQAQKDLEESELKRDSLSLKIEILQSQLNDAGVINSRLMEDITQLEDRLELEKKDTRSSNALKQQLKSLQEELESVRLALEQTQSNEKRLIDQKNKLIEEKKSLQNSLSDLKSDLFEASEKISTFESKFKASAQLIDQLQTSNQELREFYERNVQAVLQLREAETIIENHKSLQLRFASLQQDYETNMQLLQASQQQVVELTNSLEEFQLGSTSASLDGSFDDFNDSLMSEIQQVETEEIGREKQRISELEFQLEHIQMERSIEKEKAEAESAQRQADAVETALRQQEAKLQQEFETRAMETRISSQEQLATLSQQFQQFRSESDTQKEELVESERQRIQSQMAIEMSHKLDAEALNRQQSLSQLESSLTSSFQAELKEALDGQRQEIGASHQILLRQLEDKVKEANQRLEEAEKYHLTSLQEADTSHRIEVSSMLKQHHSLIEEITQRHNLLVETERQHSNGLLEQERQKWQLALHELESQFSAQKQEEISSTTRSLVEQQLQMENARELDAKKRIEAAVQHALFLESQKLEEERRNNGQALAHCQRQHEEEKRQLIQQSQVEIAATRSELQIHTEQLVQKAQEAAIENKLELERQAAVEREKHAQQINDLSQDIESKSQEIARLSQKLTHVKEKAKARLEQKKEQLVKNQQETLERQVLQQGELEKRLQSILFEEEALQRQVMELKSSESQLVHQMESIRADHSAQLQKMQSQLQQAATQQHSDSTKLMEQLQSSNLQRLEALGEEKSALSSQLQEANDMVEQLRKELERQTLFMAEKDGQLSKSADTLSSLDRENIQLKQQVVVLEAKLEELTRKLQMDLKRQRLELDQQFSREKVQWEDERRQLEDQRSVERQQQQSQEQLLRRQLGESQRQTSDLQEVIKQLEDRTQQLERERKSSESQHNSAELELQNKMKELQLQVTKYSKGYENMFAKAKDLYEEAKKWKELALKLQQQNKTSVISAVSAVGPKPEPLVPVTVPGSVSKSVRAPKTAQELAMEALQRIMDSHRRAEEKKGYGKFAMLLSPSNDRDKDITSSAYLLSSFKSPPPSSPSVGGAPSPQK